MQAAFEWSDDHLWRFALGGSPFASRSEHFRCPYDVEERADEGVAAREVRLDQTLRDKGDLLAYVYDYGDSLELTLRLESVRPVRSDGPLALCVAGRGAAPREDSG